MAAPKEAPLDTPRVKGVASGFRNIAWNAIPLTARAAPARNEGQTPGILITISGGKSETPSRSLHFARGFRLLLVTKPKEAFYVPKVAVGRQLIFSFTAPGRGKRSGNASGGVRVRRGSS